MKILFWPFTLAWKLTESMIKLTGRLVAVVLGLIVLGIGIMLSITIIGAILGIPLILIGVSLIIRGIF